MGISGKDGGNMSPGYYIDREHCLWIVYPDKRCEFHLREESFYRRSPWLYGDSYSSDEYVFGLIKLGDL
jgi:hypothetical protein